MIDHLLLFTNETIAHSILDPLGFGYPAHNDEEGISFPASWNGSYVLPCRVIIGQTPVIYKDDEGIEQTFYKDVYMDGFHINIALNTINDSLKDLEQCILITNRDKAVEGMDRQDFIIMTKVSEDTMNSVLGVTPIFSGSQYPFGKAKT